MSILDELIAVLNKDAKALSVLRTHGVSAETYTAYVYDDELRKARRVGLAIGTVLTVGLFFLAWFAAADAVSSRMAQLAFGLGGGGLGLLITWGTLRHMAGKRWKYLDEPDETSSGFNLIGMVNRLDAKHMKGLNQKTWNRLKAFRPDLSAKRYQRLPTEPHAQVERGRLMQMTPRKERIVARLGYLRRWSAYALLLVVLTPFVGDLFFLFWFWFVAGVWLALESVAGIVKRQIGVFSEATTIDLYGWPARAFAGLALFLAIVIFILPGILGMFSALGLDVVDAIF